jgi:hypothetical protein
MFRPLTSGFIFTVFSNGFKPVVLIYTDAPHLHHSS